MTRLRTKSHRRGAVPASFDALVAEMPPHAIRDEADYDSVIEMLDRLTSLPRLTPDQEQYLLTWGILVEDYESKHHAIDTSEITPLDVLRRLCEEHGMSASQFGELLGHRSLGSKVLRGERELSKAHIRTLCRHFKVSADLFLGV